MFFSPRNARRGTRRLNTNTRTRRRGLETRCRRRELTPAGLVVGGTLPPLGAGALPRGPNTNPGTRGGTTSARRETRPRTNTGTHGRDHRHANGEGYHGVEHTDSNGDGQANIDQHRIPSIAIAQVPLPPARAPLGVLSKHELFTQGSVHRPSQRCSTEEGDCHKWHGTLQKKGPLCSALLTVPHEEHAEAFLLSKKGLFVFPEAPSSPFLSCKIVALSLSRYKNRATRLVWQIVLAAAAVRSFTSRETPCRTLQISCQRAVSGSAMQPRFITKARRKTDAFAAAARGCFNQASRGTQRAKPPMRGGTQTVSQQRHRSVSRSYNSASFTLLRNADRGIDRCNGRRLCHIEPILENIIGQEILLDRQMLSQHLEINQSRPSIKQTTSVATSIAAGAAPTKKKQRPSRAETDEVQVPPRRQKGQATANGQDHHHTRQRRARRRRQPASRQAGRHKALGHQQWPSLKSITQ